MRHRFHYKFHAIALLIICGVITGMYFALAPKPPAPVDTSVHGDRYIEIYSATWGRDCNNMIQQEINNPTPTPPPFEGEEQPPEQPVKREPLKLVVTNNVLTAVGEKCNGNLTCTVLADSNWLGSEPLAACFKKLEVSYRCYQYDRLWSMKLEQGKDGTIDCNAHENSTTPVSAAAPRK